MLHHPVVEGLATHVGATVGGIHSEGDGGDDGSEERRRIDLQEEGGSAPALRTAGSRETRYKPAGAEWHSGNRTGKPLTEQLNQSAIM